MSLRDAWRARDVRMTRPGGNPAAFRACAELEALPHGPRLKMKAYYNMLRFWARTARRSARRKARRLRSIRDILGGNARLAHDPAEAKYWRKLHALAEQLVLAADPLS